MMTRNYQHALVYVLTNASINLISTQPRLQRPPDHICTVHIWLRVSKDVCVRAFVRTCMALYRRLHKECLYLMVGGMSRSDTSRNNEQFTIIEERCQGGSEGFSAPWPDCCGAFAADCLHWIRPKFQKECQCCEAGGAKNKRFPSAEIARRGAGYRVPRS